VSRNAIFTLLVALLALTSAPAILAQDSDMEYALQDAREWASAMAFVESRGLDISKGVESRTGLWSLVLEEGEGPRAKANDTVTVHATGWLADGTNSGLLTTLTIHPWSTASRAS
jgi:FKBP-type peptidyl-prolyl cis-trans isomerase